MGGQSDEPYRDAAGTILICMYCRRTLRHGPDGPQWERVERHMSDPPKGASHGLCPECLDKHYPPQR